MTRWEGCSFTTRDGLKGIRDLTFRSSHVGQRIHEYLEMDPESAATFALQERIGNHRKSLRERWSKIASEPVLASPLFLAFT